jgi:hypothetical protein
MQVDRVAGCESAAIRRLSRKIILCKGTLALAAALLLGTGCAALGPRSLPQDRYGYNSAVAESWKEQTLLNIVKLRYLDMPLFLDVTSIVSGYTLESSITLTADLIPSVADAYSAGGTGKFIDRPTVTYSPITGQRFNRQFLTPIPPDSLLFLIQAGWPVDLVLPITVESINGLRNRTSGGMNTRAADEGFGKAVQLLRTLQRCGAVGMRIVKQEDAAPSAALVFHRKGVAEETWAAFREVCELLRLKSDLTEVSISYGALPAGDGEMAVLTRSILQIMLEFAAHVDVPSDHADAGRVVPSIRNTAAVGEGAIPAFHVHTTDGKPGDALVAVRYRDHWFWIDDRDLQSKRAFTFLMVLFSLTETGGREGLPLVTIPAG